MANAWDQAGFITTNGTDISNSVGANNISFGVPKVLTTLSVWLADTALNDNGILDSFSGTLGWAIYSNNGGQPGTLLFSGTDAAPVLTDSGAQSDAGGDILKAELDLGEVALAPGNYWIAVREGAWGSASDGSAVQWIWGSPAIGGTVTAGTPAANPASWTPENLGHDSAFALAGNALWDQGNFSTAGGADISFSMVADNFSVAGYTLISGATVYLTDGAINDNGVLDSFSGSLGWGIYRTTAGEPGGTLWASGSATITITDTGLQSASGADIARVDFTFGPFNAELPAGDYFFVLREGSGLNSFNDGSPVYWTHSASVTGTGAMTPTVVGGVTDWTDTGFDTSFQLWSPVVAAEWDTPDPINEDQPILLDVLANDWHDTDVAITAIGTPGHGTAVLDDNGTPGDTSDDRIRYTPLANYSGQDTFSYTITSGNVSSVGHVTVTIRAANDAPTVTGLAGDAVAWKQGDPGVRVDADANAVLADIDSANFGGGFLNISITGGGAPGQDQLFFATDERVRLVGADLFVNGINIGSVVGSGSTISFGLSNLCTPALLSDALHYLTYANSGGTAPTPGDRTISYTLIDGDGTANGGNDTRSWTSTVHVIDLDETGIANADTRALNEAQMVNIPVLANDSTANGPLVVSFIDGVAIGSGQTVELASGAVVTLLANGKLLYDTHGAFGWLNSAATGAATGAVSSYVDKFSYTLADGSSAMVSVTVSGFDNGDGRLSGDAGSNTMTGTAAADTFMLQAGGLDHVAGGNGNDLFYFGSAYYAGDTVDGGAGSDTVALQGNYGVLGTGHEFIIGAGMLDNIETLVLMSGTNTTYGGEGGYNRYYLKLTDAAVAAGTTLTLQASKLGAFEGVEFNGSAETNAQFRLIGGDRTDILKGGAQADWFASGQGGDSLTGGGGADTFYFRATDSSYATGVDQINDLTTIDKIDLSAIDANTSTTADDPFAFIGGATFHHTAGELRATYDEFMGWTIEGDTDGDGDADLVIYATSNFTTTAGLHFTL